MGLKGPWKDVFMFKADNIVLVYVVLAIITATEPLPFLNASTTNNSPFFYSDNK